MDFKRGDKIFVLDRYAPGGIRATMKRYVESGGLAKTTTPRFGGAKYGGSCKTTHRTKSGNPYIAASRRNKRDVWSVATAQFRGAHYATFPPRLIEPCILAGCPVGGTVLDPFMGSGTTGLVAKSLNRHFAGVEINPEYHKMAVDRIASTEPSPEQIALY